MRAAARLAPALVLLGLCGCGLVPQRYQLAAEPLMDIPLNAALVRLPGPGVPAATVTVPVSSDPMAQANLLVQDSQRKCAAFVDSLFAETAGTGLTLDVLSTGTSAVSAIVTPLSAAHALGAASTVLSATKSGITANYLSTLSLAHITQAILASYNADMTDYINSLSQVPNPQQLNVFLERSKIQNIHKKCSLATAESTISGTLQTPATPAPPSGQGPVRGDAALPPLGAAAPPPEPRPLTVPPPGPAALTAPSTPGGAPLK